MRSRLFLSVGAGLVLSVFNAVSRAAEPTTKPVTRYPNVPVVRIWPDDPPATQPADGAEDGETIKISGTPDKLVFSVRNVTRAAMSVFLPAPAPHVAAKPRPAVILCAGGGYTAESLMGSGFSIARALNREGVAGFVLKYRLPPGTTPPDGTLPAPQQDLLRAIQVIRSRAAEWNVDPHRVGVMGFSSGGHLVGTAATIYDDAKSLPVPADDAVARESARPDFAVMVYPVQSLDPQYGRSGSRHWLIGDDPPEALWRRLTVDMNLTPRTPPLFVVHAKDDLAIPYQSSERLADAAKKAGVDCELMLLEHGGHGFGLGRAESKAWYPACLDWMRRHKLLD